MRLKEAIHLNEQDDTHLVDDDEHIQSMAERLISDATESLEADGEDVDQESVKNRANFFLNEVYEQIAEQIERQIAKQY